MIHADDLQTLKDEIDRLSERASRPLADSFPQLAPDDRWAIMRHVYGVYAPPLAYVEVGDGAEPVLAIYPLGEDGAVCTVGFAELFKGWMPSPEGWDEDEAPDAEALASALEQIAQQIRRGLNAK